MKNSVCERLNCILGMRVKKIFEDTKCDLTSALSWAVHARNDMHNNKGFSPNQVVFGHNPAFPNVLSDSLPILEFGSSSQVVADNRNVMLSAIIEVLKSEACENIRWGMLHQVQKKEGEDVSSGDPVYYKRNDDRWRGPGIAIGKDGRVVLRQRWNTSTIHELFLTLVCSEDNLHGDSFDGQLEHFATPRRHNSSKSIIGQCIEW